MAKRSRPAGRPVEQSAGRPERYGVDAEIERLLRCPECGSSKARPVLGSYGFFGLRAIGEFGASREIACRACGHHWVRPPMRELRREAERRVDARYDEFVAENLRLQEELVRIRNAPRTPGPEDGGEAQVAN
jgi:DNA-directed RNA polymerase subunit RPC12/RpoP